MNSIRSQLEHLRRRVVSAMHADRKQWLLRGLGAMLLGGILMLIAVVVGAVIGIYQAAT